MNSDSSKLAQAVNFTPEEPQIVLTLPMKVAQTLLRVCRSISGPPNGPRGHTSAIGAALLAAGVKLDTTIPLDGALWLGPRTLSDNTLDLGKDI